jgi:hypothetical protein
MSNIARSISSNIYPIRRVRGVAPGDAASPRPAPAATPALAELGANADESVQTEGDDGDEE